MAVHGERGGEPAEGTPAAILSQIADQPDSDETAGSNGHSNGEANGHGRSLGNGHAPYNRQGKHANSVRPR